MSKHYLWLHLLMMLYSLGGILNKIAGNSDVFSLRFILCYAGILFLLGIYAVGWQQVIKHIPLSTAFANKAVTVIWGIIWGIVFFGETITPGKIIGAIIVIIGVVSFVRVDSEEEAHG